MLPNLTKYLNTVANDKVRTAFTQTWFLVVLAGGLGMIANVVVQPQNTVNLNLLSLLLFIGSGVGQITFVLASPWIKMGVATWLFFSLNLAVITVCVITFIFLQVTQSIGGKLVENIDMSQAISITLAELNARQSIALTGFIAGGIIILVVIARGVYLVRNFPQQLTNR